MRAYLEAISNVVLERNAEELIVGVFLALILSLSTAGAYMLLRQKARDTVMLLTLLVLGINLGVMVLATGYLRMKDRAPSAMASVYRNSPPRQRIDPLTVRDVTIESLARTALLSADTDHDGVLTEEEASVALSQFLKQAQVESGGPVVSGSLNAAIKKRMQPIEFHSPPDVHDRLGHPSFEPDDSPGGSIRRSPMTGVLSDK